MMKIIIKYIDGIVKENGFALLPDGRIIETENKLINNIRGDNYYLLQLKKEGYGLKEIKDPDIQSIEIIN